MAQVVELKEYFINKSVYLNFDIQNDVIYTFHEKILGRKCQNCKKNKYLKSYFFAT
jgi:hypothetical protein